MFYSDIILSKRGPLAQVWLAAHMERKLTKHQTIKTDIGDSINVIIGQPEQPMALRMSGQLLLGVTRIYSRKTKYLLDDCNETLLKIKMAFKPGQVELLPEQVIMPNYLITLPDAATNDFILDYSDVLTNENNNINDDGIWNNGPRFHKNPINLQNSSNLRNTMDISYDDGFNLSRANTDEFNPSEYGADISIEQGRREASQAPSLFGGSDFFGNRKNPDETMSVHSLAKSNFSSTNFNLDQEYIPEPFVPQDIDLGIGEGGIDFDWGDSILPDAPQPQDIVMAEPESEADQQLISAEPNIQGVSGDPAPVAEQIQAQKPKKAKKKVKFSKAIVDDQIETGLNGRAESNAVVDVSAFTQTQKSLPFTKEDAFYARVASNPSLYFSPITTQSDGQKQFNILPFDNPLLSGSTNIFTFSWKDENNLLSKDQDAQAANETLNNDVELGRRRSSSIGLNIGNHDMDVSFNGFDDNMDTYVPEAFDDRTENPFANESINMPTSPLNRSRSRSRTPAVPVNPFSEFEGPFDQAKYTSPLMVFDSRSDHYHQTQADARSQTLTPSSREGRNEKTNMSKNTAVALNVIKEQLSSTDSTAHFNKLSEKATRRAASAFFFELLVLTTRKVVTVEQESAFGDISFGATKSLWQLDNDSILA